MTNTDDSVPLLREIGETGLKHTSGYIDEEFHPDLQGPKAAQVFKEISYNSFAAGAFMWAVGSLMGQVKWRSDPKEAMSRNSAALKEAAFLDSCLNDMDFPWEHVAANIISFLEYGFWVGEDVYKIRRGNNPRIPQLHSEYNDGRIGWRYFGPRSQKSIRNWDLTDSGRVKGLYQQPENSGRDHYIPSEKMLHIALNPGPENNPEGKSLYRNGYIHYFYAKRMYGVEAVGIERDLAGMPIMEVPLDLLKPGATAQQLAQRRMWELFVSRIRRDELYGAVIPSEIDPATQKPSGFKFRLQTSGGRNPTDVNEIVKRHESRFLMSVLAEFLMLGTEPTGTRSLADTKTSLFASAIGVVLSMIRNMMNRVAIPRLMRYNNVPRELWPELNHGDIEKQEIDKFANFLSALSSAGIIVPDEGLEAHAREVGGLPKKDPDAQPIQNQTEKENTDVNSEQKPDSAVNRGVQNPNGAAGSAVPGRSENSATNPRQDQ